MSSILTIILSLLAFALAAPLTIDVELLGVSLSTTDPNTVPLTGSTGSLPTPPSSWNLAYIAIGQGTQNYSCSAAGAAPVSIGAMAALYNATYLALPVSKPLIPSSSALALSTHSGLGLPTLGHHYFTSGIPTFSLEAADPPLFLSAKKTADVTAPADSVQGSVDWLQLTDNGDGLTNGLKGVYRVETTSGAGTTCTSASVQTVQYAAEYW